MKHKIYSIALVAALCGTIFVGCKKDNPLEGTNYNTIITVKNSDAKTHYNPDTQGVEWDEEDQISVTRGSNTFSTFVLSSLSDGVATFVGNIPDYITEGSYYGIYPAQDGLSIDDDSLNCVAIQPSQTLTNNTFGKGNNTAIGCNNSTTMQFRNVGGLAKIAVKGDMAIKSIAITDEDGQKLSGRGTINIFPNSNLSITWDRANSTNTVTALAPDQTNGISVSGGKWFYIVLPPCTLNQYTIDILDAAGDHHTKHFTSPITISRRTVTFLGGFDISEEYKQIRYTNGSTTNPTTAGFLSNARSQVYDNDNNCWVATYSGVITSIPDFAFHQNSEITSIVLPNSVTSIGRFAFYQCTNLVSAILPKVTILKEFAFEYCSSLTSVTMPCVTAIPEQAFLNDTNLTTLSFPDATRIGSSAFEMCKNLTSIEIPNATSISTSTFRGCTNLTSIDIPDATFIGESAFSLCSHLSSVTLPNITSLSSGTFYECTSLSSVVIPNVTSIQSYAFYGCTNLSDVYSKTAVPTMGDNVFDGVSGNALLHLPTSLENSSDVNWVGWPGDYIFDYEDYYND